MDKFRKKPVVIEAVQYRGENWPEVAEFLKFGGNDQFSIEHITQRVFIYTLEGDMAAQVGDWIIRGVKGEFYPCKPDIFAATYEPVAPPSQKEKP